MTEPQNPLTIVELRATNVKRLRAVAIRPDHAGNLVVLSGRNGAGKSSVLDSIVMALGGKDHVCKRPLREGAERGEVVVDLGSLVVLRTFTPGGGTSLVVRNREGARFSNPQTMLDALLGRLTFDPLAFARASAKDRAETLRNLVGLDLTEIHDRRARLLEQRRETNAEAKTARTRAVLLPVPADAPAVEESLSDLLAARDAAQATNLANARLRVGLATAEARASKTRDHAEAADAEVSRLAALLEKAQEAAAAARRDLEAQEQALEVARQRVASLVDEDLEPHDERIRTVEQRNRGARARRQRAEWEAAAAKLEAEVALATTELERIEEERAAAIAAAPMPVDGLGLDITGSVTFNGLPFDQASSAEQLRASVAIGLALNRRLRVLLIRDGSLLDSDGLQLVAEMARDAGAQVWIERVERDAATTVVIEDGEVLENPETPDTATGNPN